jgi:hypothetical protein
MKSLDPHDSEWTYHLPLFTAPAPNPGYVAVCDSIIVHGDAQECYVLAMERGRVSLQADFM